jgi:hypothetical protein
MAEPENVESLAKYRPGSRKYQISLTLSGEAGASMSQLMTQLNAETPNEVVLRAIALLVSAQGKEILLRDRKSGMTETIEV